MFTRRVLGLVANRWTILVIYALRSGTRRFAELERAIEGVSQKMLTQTLRDLERHGLLTRTVYPEVPPRVEYALTPLGRSLGPCWRHWAAGPTSISRRCKRTRALRCP